MSEQIEDTISNDKILLRMNSMWKYNSSFDEPSKYILFSCFFKFHVLLKLYSNQSAREDFHQENNISSFSTQRVARAETRLTVYRSSYIRRVIRVRSYLASLSPPRFSMTIDKSCIVAPIIIILMSRSSLSRLKMVSK